MTRARFDNPAGVPAPGGSYSHVAAVDCGPLTDIGLANEYAAVRRQYFSGTPPTSTTVGTSGLIMPGALLEVDVVAVIGGSGR